ncbi:MAG: Smr/MutS family protein [Devosia sp.]
MGRRGRSIEPPDSHLWDEVKASVTPLRPARRASRTRRVVTDAPLPMPPVENPPPKPTKVIRTIAMPSYQSPQTPGKGLPYPAIEPRLRKKLQRGTMEIDGTLDLHGMRQDEALTALTRYLKARVRRGDRTILVITGKGLKKVDGDPTTIIERGVLRTMLPLWLQSPDLAPLVAGYDVAAQTHGGEGAYYVRLRRLERLT